MSKKVEDIESIFERAERIWAAGEKKPYDRALFRRKFSFKEKESPPHTAKLYVVCESAYNLYVNGKPVVLDGSLPRTPDKIYFDTVNIAPYLQKGVNVLVFSCRYTGATDFEPGLTFSCPELVLKSDPETCAYRSLAYINEYDSETGRYLVTYDATREGQIDNVNQAAYESNIFAPTESFGIFEPGEGVALLPRPIPLYRFSKLLSAKRVAKTSELNCEIYEAEIGEAGFFLPHLEISAAGGTEEIMIKTDRYICAGSLEPDGKPVENTALKYICKNGKQTFDSPAVLSGTKIIVKMPKTVKLAGIYYYKSEYDFEYAGDFECGDKEMDALLSRAEVTIETCMRDTLYASPDRNPAFLPAEASAVFHGVQYTFDMSARKLVQKCVTDYLCNLDTFIESEGIFDNLLAFSARGIIASYAVSGGDLELIKENISVIARFLNRFNTDGEILILPEEARRRDCDDYRNVDMPILFNCVYVSAADFFGKLCKKIGVSIEEGEDINVRAQQIKTSFAQKFRKSHGYASSDFYDERANAWAVISGLAEKEMYSELKKTLATCQNASPRFETYVIEALFRIGAVENALMRLKNRFHLTAGSENPTLYEGFFNDGAYAWSASAGYQYNFYRYIAGVRYGLDKISIRPCLTAFGEVKFSVASGDDMIRGLYRADKKEILIDIPSGCPVAELVLEPEWTGTDLPRRVIKLNKGKNKFNL